MEEAINLLQPLKEQYPAISWADLLQLAAVTGIEFSGLYLISFLRSILPKLVVGGPKIPLRYGRVDVYSPDMAMPPGNLPAAAGPWATTPQDQLREVQSLLAASLSFIQVFYRMGLDDKEIVALSGAHTLGRARTFGKEVSLMLFPPSLLCTLADDKVHICSKCLPLWYSGRELGQGG